MTSRMLRIVRHSADGMGRNRLRTFFMMLGTFIGVAALTVTVAIGRGTQREVMQRFNRMLSGSSVFLRAGGGQMRIGAHGAPATTLTVEDVRAIDSTLDQVERADPVHMAGAREVIYDGQSRQIRIEGHSEAAETVWNRSVTRGAYFTAADVASAARVALVGEVVVRDLFQGRDPIGQQIRIGTVPLQVIGVLEPMGTDPHGLDKDNEIIIPISTMMRRVLNIDYIFGAKLSLRQDADMDATTVAIRDILRRRHSLDPDQADDFHLFTPIQVQRMVRSSNRVFTLFVPLVAALSILVGGLVVANLMLMTVNERQAEIGLRQAVGARPRDIRLQFLAESAAVTGLGGLLAVGTGFIIVGLLAHLTGTRPVMPWGPALLGVAAATAIGILAGVVPARRAAQLDPVQTLR
jgi:putative ABC transport system permease protein